MPDPVVFARAALASVELFDTEFKTSEQLLQEIYKYAEENGKSKQWVSLQFFDHSTIEFGDSSLETILKVAIAVKEKLVSKTIAAPDQIEFAKHAVAFLYNKSVLKDDDLALAILGGKPDEDQVAQIVSLAFENEWDGEPPPTVEQPAEKSAPKKEAELIPFLEKDEPIQDVEEVKDETVEDEDPGQRERLPEDARAGETEKQLPAVVEQIALTRGDDGIWRDSQTGEVMMSEEEALGALRITKPKFEIVDSITADQYVGWLRELQHKAIDYAEQAVARVGEVLTVINSISYYYNPALKAVVAPMLKMKKDGTLAAKNVKLPSGTVFFASRGGPVIVNARELREWAENLPKSKWSFYGITEETKVKIDNKKIKELVAAGTEIPGTKNFDVDPIGIMKVGIGRSGFSLLKVRHALNPMSAKLKSLRFIEFGKIPTIKEEKPNDYEEDEEDFE